MMKKSFLFLATSLLGTLILSNSGEAGNIKKTYINVSKEGQQAQASDIPLNYSNIENNFKNISYDYFGHHGTITGAVKVTDKPEGIGTDSLSFKTSSDQVSISSSSFSMPKKAYTLEFWSKKEGAGPLEPRAIPVSKYANYIDIGYSSGIMFSIDTVNGGQQLVKGGSLPEIGKWYHYAGTYDGTIAKLYVNGKLVGTLAKTGDVDDSGDLIFGHFSSGNYNFNGKLSEVRIWNYARDEKQIVENMNKSLIGIESGLIGYWNFK